MKKLLIIVIIAMTVVVAGCASNPSESIDNSGYTASQKQTLAQCLTDNGVVMYGTERCPHCQNQKKRFGDAVDLITFVDCDQNRIQCTAAGVQGFPTWITPDGQKYPGDQSLSTLADIAGCTL